MKATIKDGNVDYQYEITPNGGQFDIGYAGNVVGSIQKNGSWQQTSGVALAPNIFRQLVLYIEAYFD